MLVLRFYDKDYKQPWTDFELHCIRFYVTFQLFPMDNIWHSFHSYHDIIQVAAGSNVCFIIFTLLSKDI